MVESLRKNERVFITIDSTIADGLAVNKIGVNTFYNCKGMVDKMVCILAQLNESFPYINLFLSFLPIVFMLSIIA